MVEAIYFTWHKKLLAPYIKFYTKFTITIQDLT